MRTFLPMPNLYRAMGMAVVVTGMSAPRIVQAGIEPRILIPASFLLMTFVCGAVTAWGTSAGMPGIVTDRRTFLQGALVAVALTLIILPIQILWTDPVIYKALLECSKPAAADLAFPPTQEGRVALLLWAAGFQVMFLQAAPMSLFARLTNRRYLALGLCLLFRVYVAHRQIADVGMADAVPLFLLSNILCAAAGCLLFARFGLAPTILFAAGLDLHLFLATPVDR
jgi:hypothetical protein